MKNREKLAMVISFIAGIYSMIRYPINCVENPLLHNLIYEIKYWGPVVIFFGVYLCLYYKSIRSKNNEKENM